ncbi:MAG: hypothetical protein IT361_15640 [Gemmatimonadaceae bacterium]|nr:hypothetical protein [Gemmatimonadaceae bacterium]
MTPFPSFARAAQHLAVALWLVGVARPTGAQVRDTARVVPVRPDRVAPRPSVRDSLAPPISPRRAFLYSLAVPGLGQSRLQRPTAGAVYVAFEMSAITMLVKSRYDLAIAKRRVRERIVDVYEIDANTGLPVFDAEGRPKVKSLVPNRYATDDRNELRSRLKARRLHYEDWVAMLAFTHLFSGADAFVSAHLWDLPGQLEFRRLPSGATGVGARVTFR